MNQITKKHQTYDIRELVKIIESYGFRFSNVSIFNFFNKCGIKPHHVEILPNKRQRFYYDRRSLVILALYLRNRIRSTRKEIRCIDCGKSYSSDQLVNHYCPSCHSMRYAVRYCFDGWKDEGRFNAIKARLLLKSIIQLLRSHR